MNITICNFPSFGPIFMKSSPKCRLGIFFIFLGSNSIGKGPIFGPKFGVGKWPTIYAVTNSMVVRSVIQWMDYIIAVICRCPTPIYMRLYFSC